MKYYMIQQSDIPIGILTENDFIYVMNNGIADIRIKHKEKAMGILFNNTIYHVIGYNDFPKNVNHEEAEIEEITLSAYNILKEVFDSSKEITSDVIENLNYSDNNDVVDKNTFDYIVKSKISEMSKKCNDIIIKGFDVELSDGITYHFSFTLEDQMNITECTELSRQLGEWAYHSDGGECRLYKYADMYKIAQYGIAHKTYYTAYYNSLKIFIKSKTTANEVNEIKFGDDIPQEYKTEGMIYAEQLVVAIKSGLSMDDIISKGGSKDD